MKERDNIYYFPSYEIMMDDLRDYRFYAEDMKHPTLQAVGYIYSIFSDTYYSPSTREACPSVRTIHPPSRPPPARCGY